MSAIIHFEEDDGEVFVHIRGYEGLYMISNRGRVFGLTSSQFLNPSESERYLRAGLSKNGHHVGHLVHRLVCLHFVSGRTEKRCQVDHIDRNKRNNHFSNLRWFSIREQFTNIERQSKHGHSIEEFYPGSFRVSLRINGKRFRASPFKSVEEAIEARDKLIEENDL